MPSPDRCSGHLCFVYSTPLILERKPPFSWNCSSFHSILLLTKRHHYFLTSLATASRLKDDSNSPLYINPSPSLPSAFWLWTKSIRLSYKIVEPISIKLICGWWYQMTDRGREEKSRWKIEMQKIRRWERSDGEILLNAKTSPVVSWTQF